VITMKKFTLSALTAGALAAGLFGFAAPAQADIDHHGWIQDIQPTVTVPHVDNTVRHSGR
jgi:hypothetical protein